MEVLVNIDQGAPVLRMQVQLHIVDYLAMANHISTH